MQPLKIIISSHIVVYTSVNDGKNILLAYHGINNFYCVSVQSVFEYC